MHPFLHTIGVIAVLPYLALAAFFLFIGELARTKGLFELVEIAFSHANWVLRWGMYGAAALWLALLVMGYVPRFQRAGSLCLLVLAAGSLIVITALQSGTLESGHLLFLLPCALVCALSGWLFWRAGLESQ